MPDTGMTFAAFIVAAVVMELTPGPNMLWLAILSATHGMRSAVPAVLGVTLGLGLLALVAAFGLATLIAEYPAIYETLRWAGVAFMVYLAAEAWFSKPAAAGATPHAGAARWFLRGTIINLLNPKAAAVYLTLIPAAAQRPDAGGGQIFVLSAIYVGIATLAHLLIISFSGRLGRLFASSRRERYIRKTMAIALLLVAIWLGVSTASPR